MGELLQDLRYAIRTFLKNPAFTTTAVAALAVGIGVNVAVFSIVDTVLLKRVPHPDPDRLVVFATVFPGGPNYITSDMKFNLWREQVSAVGDVSGYRYTSMNLTGLERSEQVQGALVTSDYFRLLGLGVARGRTFSEAEVRDGHNLAVFSDAFWRRAFGGDSQIVGRKISLNDAVFEVIGVLDPNARTTAPQPVDVWTPLTIDPNSNNQIHYFSAIGRLSPDVSLDAANVQLRLTADEFRQRYPNAVAMGPQATFGVRPMKDAMVRDIRNWLFVLLGAVAFVLLMACANVANLTLARAGARQRELASRRAVGASRARLGRQLLTESLVLSLTGGALGLILGGIGIRVLLWINPGNIPRIGEYGSAVTIDWRVAAFAAVTSMMTGVFFGIVPALEGSKADLVTPLKEAAPTSSARFRKGFGSFLVVSEVALAVVLTTAAVLLAMSFLKLRAIDPGFDVRDILTVRMSLASTRFDTTASVEGFIQDAVRRVRTLPGVTATAYTNYLPLEGGATIPYIVEGRPLAGPFHGFGPWTSVSSDYFDVLRIPLVRGRLFTDRDNQSAPGVVIINQALARQSWPDGDPIGARIAVGRGSGPEFEEPPREIVGVVGDVHDGPVGRPPQPAVYVPSAQLPDRLTARFVRGSVAWIVRTQGNPQALAAAVERELQQASGGLPTARVRSMEEIWRQSNARASFSMAVMTGFGVSALLLAAIGIYGLMAYSVAVRAHEIAVRLALGAPRSSVRNMIVWDGMRLALAGLVIGVIAALALGGMIASFLFGIQPRDPVMLTTAVGVLAVVALVSVYLPALRASRLDAVDLLRRA
jgi:putative ABC transport system permease protein